METRKVQQVGGGTFTVSLPVTWAREHDLEAGGTAYLYTHRDGSLVVRWNERGDGDLAATRVDLGDPAPETARRELRAAYTAGFERITLDPPGTFDAEQRRALETTARTLTGLEVTEKTDGELTVRGLLDAEDVSIRQSTRHLRFVALSMHEAALELLAGERGDTAHVVERDDDADRLFRLITRHFNRALLELSEPDRLGVTRPRLFDHYRTARQFERVADHAVRIARSVDRVDGEPDGPLVEEVLTLAADARAVVVDAADAVADEAATGLAHAALEDRAAVLDRVRTLDARLPERAPEEAYVLTRVLDSVERTADCGGNVAELALRTAVRE